jgi:hypothetical protein
MDGDLFRWLLVALGAAGVLVLVALLSTLNGIKKALEKGGPGALPTSSAAIPASASEPEPVVDETPVVAEEATPQAQAASIRTVLQEQAATPVVRAQPVEAQPVQAQPVQAEPVQAQPVAQAAASAAQASAFAAHADADEPQDEPFQRDGRWWFRRGQELLLYDEASGQWQPAETAAAPVAAQAAATVTEAAPVAASTAGWKCANCGAVNGSTATSCRMCFTARP